MNGVTNDASETAWVHHLESLPSPPPASHFSPLPKIVFDLQGMHSLYSPSPPLARFLERHGLDCAVTIPEVRSAFLEGFARAARCRPVGRELLLAHSETIASSFGILFQSPCLTDARRRILTNQVVQRMLREKSSWRLPALVVAAAVELGMPILGSGSFYRAYAEHFPIPAGVCDPESGEWVVPPAE